MLTLIVWMVFNGSNIMTMQAVPAEMCDAMSENMAAQPDVTHVVCTTSPVRIAEAIEAGECAPLQQGDSFINYTCRKPDYR